MSITPISQNGGASASQNSQSGTAGLSTGGVVANESTFLTLLVAQLKNQDPLSPTDSTQFMGQLAQFSSLEQLTNINTNVGTLVTDAAASSGTTQTQKSSNGKS